MCESLLSRGKDYHPERLLAATFGVPDSRVAGLK